jgi:hypothetical protein
MITTAAPSKGHPQDWQVLSLAEFSSPQAWHFFNFIGFIPYYSKLSIPY